ncbi:hypothetical protein GRF29_69g809247 [Pseudopithomyces chartarum]|uniref:Uncharacterized protein n=1 Tax=Pseudopithomyces chartarum TaxID=1892770 RepID=A0AAN6RHP2_9PLEO|nr:hypothetical protein GRF29_69g809247 [Pseudopithomyces chartarum]
MSGYPDHSSMPDAVPTRSKLLSTGFRDFVNRHALAHPQKALTVQLHNAEVCANMSNGNFPRQQMHLIIALYSCQPTVERVKRYTADCVYDDQFVYANDRYKMAGQWFALPKLFKSSVNESYEVIRSDEDMIQFKNKQSWTFRLIPKTATITGLVSLVLDPATKDSDFMQIKYHKDQANDKDYSHEGLGFSFKKWQADNVVKHMDTPELKEFEQDRTAAKEHVRKYGTGTEEGEAPKRDFTS